MHAATGNDLSPFGVYRPHGALLRLLNFTRRPVGHWITLRAALMLRGFGLRRLRARPVDVTVDTIGARMRLYPYNNAAEKRLLFTPQLADREERAFIAARLSPDMTFIDIGAGCGATSLFISLKAGPRARVLAVEPQPMLFERLVYNLRQNAGAMVKAVNCALADSESETTLFFNPYDLSEASIRVVNVEGGGGSVPVPAKSLATLTREENFDRIDLMKLDIEGAEDVVLEPYLSNEPKRRWPRALILAISPTRWDSDLFALLARKGYRRVMQTRISVMFEREGEE